MSKIDCIQSEHAAGFDEILPILKCGLDSSAAFAGKKNGLACKGNHILSPTQLIRVDESVCVCGGNILLNGCCAKHNVSKVRTSQLEPFPASSLKAAESTEDLFVAMFRDYFGIPTTVEIS